MRKLPRIALILACWIGLAETSPPPRPLQPLIDAAAPGSELLLEAGVYAGPIVVDKPITLDGQGAATIDAGGKGTVVLLRASGASLRGLRIRGSGESHNDLDAGIHVRGNYNVIKDNVIEDCLFGIDLQQSDNNILRRNEITSKPLSLGLRGDSIRLWYSMGNEIADNVIRESRDFVIWYSQRNNVFRNKISDCRYGLHFMYAGMSKVEENEFDYNNVGVFVMYSFEVEFRKNRIASSTGAGAMGLGFKEASDVVARDNAILYCPTGIYLDGSPDDPESKNQFTANQIAYNDVGILLHSDWAGNEFRNNDFMNNVMSVAVQSEGVARRNVWDGNHWDDYEGFDRNGDGVGDTPYSMYAYADRIWMDVPAARFFRGAPALEALDLLERLMPFSEPRLVLVDERPAFNGQE